MFSFLLGIYLGVEMLGLILMLCFNFLRNCHIVLQSDCTILHPHRQCIRAPVSPHPHQNFYCPSCSHPSWCEVLFHYGFDFKKSRDCDTEWSKSEREKQILYINAYMWSLEKWYRWTSLQGRNRDKDVENKRMDTKGGKRWGVGGCDELGDWDWHVYTNTYKMDN